MQFLAPPSALKISLLPDRQQSNVTRLCKVHRVQHVRSEAVMFSFGEKNGHRARDRQMSG